MKRTLSSLFGALLFVSIFFRTTEAHALGPVEVELGARLGYATNPDSNISNPLGTNVGLRGGLELFHRLYLGVNGQYYFGSSVDTPLSGPGTDGTVTTHTTLLGLEAGYSFHVSLLTIRPQLGFGDAQITTLGNYQPDAITTTSLPNYTVTNTRFYLEPGIVALVNIGILYAGADANILVITDGNTQDSKAYTSFAFGLQAGLRF
jgi:hypothetical protein